MARELVATLASKLGLDTTDVEPKSQTVVGIYLGKKSATTKLGAPMWVLYFLCEGDSVETINMVETADRPRLVAGQPYSARWYGNAFECIEGANGFPVNVEGDAAV